MKESKNMPTKKKKQKTTVYEVRFLMKIEGEYSNEDSDQEVAVEETIAAIVDAEIHGFSVSEGGIKIDDATGFNVKHYGEDFA